MHLTIHNRSNARRFAPFVVCIHDATPAYARETEALVRLLTPLLGRRLSFGVVPNWIGEWPLTAYRDYCQLLLESSDELLLHGYSHRRSRGWSPTTWLAEGSDEMNGLSAEKTRCILERGQQMFADAFGAPARGFLAPAWQRGHVAGGVLRPGPFGLDHVLGFFTLDSRDGRTVRLATSSWDCGRWAWLGHVGDRLGALLQALDRRIPVLAIHPRDLERGYWPNIHRLTAALLDSGHEPTTPAQLLGGRPC